MGRLAVSMTSASQTKKAAGMASVSQVQKIASHVRKTVSAHLAKRAKTAFVNRPIPAEMAHVIRAQKIVRLAPKTVPVAQANYAKMVPVKKVRLVGMANATLPKMKIA